MIEQKPPKHDWEVAYHYIDSMGNPAVGGRKVMVTLTKRGFPYSYVARTSHFNPASIPPSHLRAAEKKLRKHEGYIDRGEKVPQILRVRQVLELLRTSPHGAGRAAIVETLATQGHALTVEELHPIIVQAISRGFIYSQSDVLCTHCLQSETIYHISDEGRIYLTGFRPISEELPTEEIRL